MTIIDLPRRLRDAVPTIVAWKLRDVVPKAREVANSAPAALAIERRAA
jgi:hypothetical protein